MNSNNNPPAPLWTPDADRVANSRLTHYMDWLKAEKGLSFSDYPQLWDWSVDQLESFYASLWEYFDIRHSQPYTRVLDGHAMPGAKWFEGARLNLAEQVFRFHIGDPGRPAIESRSELRGRQTLTWGELHRQIAAHTHTVFRYLDRFQPAVDSMFIDRMVAGHYWILKQLGAQAAFRGHLERYLRDI